MRRPARGALAIAASPTRCAHGTVVRAAAAGTVTFAGPVVDVRYVVVRHADGLLATYGGLDTISVSRGCTGRRRVGGRHDRCELYFGLRTAPDVYIDPAPLIGALVVPPYLVPTDGTPPRPPPDPILRCVVVTATSLVTAAIAGVDPGSRPDSIVRRLIDR